MLLPLRLYLCPDEDSKSVLADATSKGLAVSHTPSAAYGRATLRIAEAETATHLTVQMRSALSSLLSVLDNHLRHTPATDHPLITRIASGNITLDELREVASDVDAGLILFATKAGRIEQSQRGPLSCKTVSLLDCPLSPKDACRARDKSTCLVNGVRQGVRIGPEARYILPFSMEESTTASFWKLVRTFLDTSLMQILADIMALGVDCVQNLILLSTEVHCYFGPGLLVLVPDITGSLNSYDASTVTEYTATVEMPYGSKEVSLAVFKYQDLPGGRSGSALCHLLTPGETITFRTTDTEAMPLPHPLLLQIHALCSRMGYLRTAAGHPLNRYYSDDYGTEVSAYDGSLSFSDDDAISGEPQDWISGSEVDWAEYTWFLNNAGLGLGIAKPDTKLVGQRDHLTGMETVQRKDAYQLAKDDLREYGEEVPREISVVMSEALERVVEKQLLFDGRIGGWEEGGSDLG